MDPSYLKIGCSCMSDTSVDPVFPVGFYGLHAVRAICSAGNPNMCGPIPEGVPVAEGRSAYYNVTQVIHPVLPCTPHDSLSSWSI